MDYELAKKLKDAGFSQRGEGKYLCPGGLGPFDGACPIVSDIDGSVIREGLGTHKCGDRIYHPTLEELIANLWLEINKK